MSEFQVNVSTLQKSANSQKNISQKLSQLGVSISEISGSLKLSGESGAGVKITLKNLAQQTEKNANKLSNASIALTQIASEYQRTEESIMGLVPGQSEDLLSYIDSTLENMPEFVDKLLEKIMDFIGLKSIYKAVKLLYKIAVNRDLEASDFDFLWEKDAADDASIVDKSLIKIENIVTTSLVEFGARIWNKSGEMGNIITLHDSLVKSASKKCVHGDIAGGLLDLGASLAVGILGIGYGAVAVYSIAVGSVMESASKISSVVTAVTGKIPGSLGTALYGISSGINEVLQGASDFYNGFGMTTYESGGGTW